MPLLKASPHLIGQEKNKQEQDFALNAPQVARISGVASVVIKRCAREGGWGGKS